MGAFRYLGPLETGVAWGGSMDNPDHGWFDATAQFTPLCDATRV